MSGSKKRLQLFALIVFPGVGWMLSLVEGAYVVMVVACTPSRGGIIPSISLVAKLLRNQRNLEYAFRDVEER